MRGLLAIVVLAVMTANGGAGCSRSGFGPCGDGCPPGTVCNQDTGRCVEPRPPDCPQDLGRYLTLAVDSDQTLVFAAYTAAYGDLVVGRQKPDGTLSCTYVDGTPMLRSDAERGDPSTFLLGDDVGLYASLALDVLDRPHVAYFDRTHGRLKYAFKGAEGWELVTVPRTAEEDHVVGRACSLALDSGGMPHIAFVDETGGSVKVARKSPEGRWAIERILAEPGDAWPGTLDGEVGRMVSLVVDTKDRAWVAFRHLLHGSLQVAVRQADRWSVLELDEGEDVGTWIDAALDRDGNMALAYHHRGCGCLKYAFNHDGALEKLVVDNGEEVTASGARRRHPVGQHCALAFGADGLPRIVYLDATTLDLKLVTGDSNESFTEPVVMDTEGPVGFFSDLAAGTGAIHAGSCRYQRNQQGGADAALQLYTLETGAGRGGSGP